MLFRVFLLRMWKLALSIVELQSSLLYRAGLLQFMVTWRLQRNCFLVRGARVAQWSEHSPPTNVARVRILASTQYVGWVCCWFSPLLREVFLRVLRFSPLLKNQHFQIPIRSGKHGHVSTSSYELLSAPWVKKFTKFFNLQRSTLRKLNRRWRATVTPERWSLLHMSRACWKSHSVC